MSTLGLPITPRSLKRLFAAVAASALLALTPVVASAGANAGGEPASKPCDEKDLAKDLAKDKDKCDPFDGDGRKN